MNSSQKPSPGKAPEPDKAKADVSRQATLDPKLSDPDKTPGSGMVPEGESDAPTG
jgi:hypothetical protein